MRTATTAILTPPAMAARVSLVRPASALQHQYHHHQQQQHHHHQAHARTYSQSSSRRLPTAIARAERAADLKKHPESALTQQKLEDRKGNRHWDEKNATQSEADIKADHDAEADKAQQGEQKSTQK